MAHEATMSREEELQEAERQLYRLLFDKPVEQMTGNEASIFVLLSQEEAVQEPLRRARELIQRAKTQAAS